MKHYMTGALGEALARSNARLDELIAVPKQKKGKKATSGCPYCFDPKLAKLGESISGGPARRLIPWLGAEFYNRASASELSRPKPVMTEETKARLKKYDAARVRDNGDPIAQMLREAVTLDDTYAVGFKYLGIPEPELRARYGHLNNGQQRMNIGNLMRGKFKREHPGQLLPSTKREKTELKIVGIKATGKPKSSKRSKK